MRTLRTSKGLEVQTHLGDQEAIGIVAASRTNNFGRTLVDQHKRGIRLSEAQWAWVHKIALDATGQPQQAKIDPASQDNLLPIYNFVKRGHRSGAGFPLIRLKMPDERLIFIGLKSGATSLNPWQVQIRGWRWDAGSYYGRVDALGIFYRAKECDQTVFTFLQQLAANPAAVVADHGFRTGACALCGQDLMTDAALAHGYGWACAANFQLPWSEVATTAK